MITEKYLIPMSVSMILLVVEAELGKVQNIFYVIITENLIEEFEVGVILILYIFKVLILFLYRALLYVRS